MVVVEVAVVRDKLACTSHKGDSAWIALLLLLPAAAIPAAAAALECLGYWRDEARRFLSHGRRGAY